MFMLCNMLILNLVLQIVIIYILVLIWKLPNYLTRLLCTTSPYVHPRGDDSVLLAPWGVLRSRGVVYVAVGVHGLAGGTTPHGHGARGRVRGWHGVLAFLLVDLKDGGKEVLLDEWAAVAAFFIGAGQKMLSGPHDV
jgi:hypothetical protein